MKVAIAHDYLTQQGGAERVVLTMLEALGNPPVYTSLYLPEGTYPEFGSADIRTSALNRIDFLRRHHRVALPLLAPTFSRMSIDAGVVVCSSSGWAHGAGVTGRKIVYCYSPARWLYQTDRYLGDGLSLGRAALGLMGSGLRRWDRKAARSAHRYLTLSTAVAVRIRETYDIDAEVLHPPPNLDPEGEHEPAPGLEPGFFLCVSRLLPYKNVGAIASAFENLPSERLVIVGTGPLEAELRASAPANVELLGRVPEPQLRWLYAQCRALIAASYEDYGLTPLEAALFGKPAVVLRAGGFLDTIDEGVSGVFFDSPEPAQIADAIRRSAEAGFDPERISQHVRGFSKKRFSERLREVVEEELAY